ncbi:MAG: SUMF1/EgtB/PvdO family nonheme iron enzyme [Sedimenticolaceae bacterium]
MSSNHHCRQMRSWLALLIGSLAFAAMNGAWSADILDGSAPAPNTPDSLMPGDTYRDCDACPEMVVVPAGRLEMGSVGNRAEETPVHSVVIPGPFAIGVYEVTVDEWDACLREGGCRQSPQQGQEGRLPMVNISWDDAQRYVAWLSAKTGRKYRLPTEAEWEYAARAGSSTLFWWGDAPGDTRANCADCGGAWGGKSTAPVGSFQPNPFGLHDVHGNAWEWTGDCWNPSYTGAPADGTPWLRGDCISRVLRGGSWALDHDYMRSARRSRYDRDVRYYLNGLRVVSELPARKEGDMPFAATVQDAAQKVFSKAPAAAPGSGPAAVIIDPLIDGLSGTQSVATQAMGAQLVELLSTRYPQFVVQDPAASGGGQTPYVVIGTFTGVNKERKTTGERVAYRICLVLLDVRSGRIASKAKVFSQADGVDIMPSPFFRDSPAWLPDPYTQAYIRTCQATKPGDPIDPLYADRLRTSALINEAIAAYEDGDYRRSQELFGRAAGTPGGDQLRILNGLYLSSWALGQHQQAAAAFDRIVDLGLDGGRLTIKFPFGPNSTDLLMDEADTGQTNLWLTQIARGVVRRGGCLEIVGHTQRGGPEILNERLSLRRAEYVMRRLAAEAPALRDRMIATGRGSTGNLVGSGKGGSEDALDRRIEFELIGCELPTPGQTQ